MAERIAIGADHGGYSLKEEIKSLLKRKKKVVDDVGTFSEESCDYPRYAFDVARKVARGEADRGILICKTGIGMAVAANKYPGVRAGVCLSNADALSSRQHNDVNVLVLAAMRVTEEEAKKITAIWLRTAAQKGRHARRVAQIREHEKKVFKKRV